MNAIKTFQILGKTVTIDYSDSDKLAKYLDIVGLEGSWHDDDDRPIYGKGKGDPERYLPHLSYEQKLAILALGMNND